MSSNNVRLQCDNSAAVSVLQSGQGRASFLLSCAREVWAYIAQCKFEICVQHIPGCQYTLADQLGHYLSDASCRARVDEFIVYKFYTAPCGHIPFQIIPTFSGFLILVIFIKSICHSHDTDWYIVWYIVVFVCSPADLTSLKWATLATKRISNHRSNHTYRELSRKGYAMSQLCSIHYDFPITLHTPRAYGQWSVSDHYGDK